MQGLHLTADLHCCVCPPALMVDAGAIADLCRRHTVAAGLAVVGETWVAFPGAGGVTGTLLLAESHLAIHTWPEQGSVTLDVYVCNFSGDNSARAERLLKELVAAFEPGRVQTHRLLRGDLAGG